MKKSLDKYIGAQMKYWEVQKHSITDADEKKKAERHFITISREYGCSGFSIGKEITEIMNGAAEKPEPLWAAYERQVLDRVMEDMGISSFLAKTMTDDAQRNMTNVIKSTFSKLPPQVAVYQKLAETIRLLAVNGNVVIVGRAANVITRGMAGGYHVMIIAPMEYKIMNVMKLKNVSKKEAEKLVVENTKRRVNYIREYVNFDVNDYHNYDLVINLLNYSATGAANLIIEGMKLQGSH